MPPSPQVAREDLVFSLQPEGEIGGAVGDDQAGQPVRPPGDLQLQMRKIIAPDLGNDDRSFEKKGHADRGGPPLYSRVARMHVTVA